LQIFQEDPNMCCFFAVLLFFGPRLGILVAWLTAWGRLRMKAGFGGFNFPWLVGILGLVLVPWATLMYIIILPVTGFDWVWIGLALAADVAGWIGGDRHRQKVPGYSTVMPGDVPPSAPPPAAQPPAAPPPAAPPPAAPPATPPPAAPSEPAP
jgi:hypothetical protein